MTDRPDEGDKDLQAILRRWVRWLRAGGSALSASLAAAYEERVGREQDGYRDPVAEFVDLRIAKLTRFHRRLIVRTWYGEEAQEAMGKDLGLSRHGVRVHLIRAEAELSGAIRAITGQAPTERDLEAWVSRQVISAS